MYLIFFIKPNKNYAFKKAAAHEKRATDKCQAFDPSINTGRKKLVELTLCTGNHAHPSVAAGIRTSD